MSNESSDEAIRGLQIVYGALLLGALMFGCVVSVLRLEGLLELGDSAEELAILGWVAAGVGITLIPVSFAVRSVMRGRAADAKDAIERIHLFRASTIASAAIIEGGLMFNIVALMLTGNFALNGGVALFGWLVMLVLFPTREQFDSLRV